MAGTYDPNDPKHVRPRENRAKLELRRADDDRRAVLASPEGRRFVYRFIASCHVLESAWRPGGPEAARSQDFALGEQFAGFRMMQETENAAPDQIALMMEEARQAKAIEAQTQAAEITPPADEEPQEQTDG